MQYVFILNAFIMMLLQCKLEICNIVIFFYSPRFELPMGASEQPPLPLQSQNQSKVRRCIHSPASL